MNVENTDSGTTVELSEDEHRIFENVFAIAQNECYDVGLDEMCEQAREYRLKLVNNRPYDRR